jgi:hypothetical protein
MTNLGQPRGRIDQCAIFMAWMNQLFSSTSVPKYQFFTDDYPKYLRFISKKEVDDLWLDVDFENSTMPESNFYLLANVARRIGDHALSHKMVEGMRGRWPNSILADRAWLESETDKHGIAHLPSALTRISKDARSDHIIKQMVKRARMSEFRSLLQTLGENWELDSPNEGPVAPRIDPESLHGNLLMQAKKAELVSEPFRHRIIDKFLPDRLYRHLTAMIPTVDQIKWRKSQGQFRADWQLPREDSNQLTQDLLTFFDETWLTNFVLNAVGFTDLPRLAKEHGFNLIPSFRLTIDQKNYHLGPHRDAFDRLATILLYLPQRENADYTGTSFYSPLVELPDDDFGNHYPFEKFENVGTVGFLPNSAFMFSNLGSAYHGVEPVHSDDLRPMLQYTIKLEPNDLYQGLEA